jgi:hypothetical protein
MYFEKDNVSINEECREITAQNIGVEVVYLDEGFEEINPTTEFRTECMKQFSS